MPDSRTDALQRVIADSQWWSDFSKSEAWAKLKERIEKESYRTG